MVCVERESVANGMNMKVSPIQVLCEKPIDEKQLYTLSEKLPSQSTVDDMLKDEAFVEEMVRSHMMKETSRKNKCRRRRKEAMQMILRRLNSTGRTCKALCATMRLVSREFMCVLVH